MLYQSAVRQLFSKEIGRKIAVDANRGQTLFTRPS